MQAHNVTVPLAQPQVYHYDREHSDPELLNTAFHKVLKTQRYSRYNGKECEVPQHREGEASGIVA